MVLILCVEKLKAENDRCLMIVIGSAQSDLHWNEEVYLMLWS